MKEKIYLSELKGGERGLVIEVKEIESQHDPVFMLLLQKGIYPGALVEVQSNLPTGALLLKIGRVTLALTRGIAEKIIVKKV